MKRLLVLLCLVTFSACSSGNPSPPAIAVTGITLNHTALDFTIGDAPVTLTPTILPDDATNKKVSWKTDESTVAAVTNEGIVSPKSAGTAIVTATTEDGGFSATCIVNISKKSVPITGVTLDQTELTLVAGGPTRTLSATVSPATAQDKTVIWSTSDPTVATVSNGVVTPSSAGNAVITVTTVDGNHIARCAVSVTAQPVAVTGVTLNPTEVTLEVGGAPATLTATVLPNNAGNKAIIWSSSTPSVATVSNGVVTPIAGGNATILVTTVSGSKSASCKVIVAPGPGWAITTSSSATSYIRVADLAIPPDFTLEAWVKPAGVSNDQFVISKQKSGERENQFRLGFFSGDAYFMMTDSSAGGDLWKDDSYQLAAPAPAGDWTHLAVTKSGANFALYIDGRTAATFTANTNLIHQGTASLELGAGVDSTGKSAVNVLDGTLDEVRIWNIARTQTDIATDMGKAIFPTHSQYSNLIAYYQFDEGAGTQLGDTKGSHPGELVNNPTWVRGTAPTGGSGIWNTAVLPVPTADQAAWQRRELTAFFHFGMNTFTDREWGDGTESPSTFNPTALDASQWINTIKNAGFRQATLVAKHHDGFCLWPSKYTAHSVKNSPWKSGNGDVVREFTDAAHAAGIKVGLYLSPWDRHESTFGTADYNTYYKNQLTELMTGYGDIDEVWFDGANGDPGKTQNYDWAGFFALIRNLQPHALLAVMGPDIRWVGNESGEAPLDETSVKIRDASRVWYPSECDVSIRPGWFYHPSEDGSLKSVATLLDIYMKSVGRNSTLLLNIPPDRRGRIADPDINRLNDFATALTQAFSENLALRKGASADSTQAGSPAYAAGQANDGDLSTYWVAANGKQTGRLEIDLGTPRTFNLVSIREPIELGERSLAYHIEVEQRSGWQTVASGTTIGQRNLRVFTTQTAQKVALVIESARNVPAIAEFGVFLAPALAAGP